VVIELVLRRSLVYLEEPVDDDVDAFLEYNVRDAVVAGRLVR